MDNFICNHCGGPLVLRMDTSPVKCNGCGRPAELKKHVQKSKENNDMVNSPNHYTQGKYETIDIILDVTKNLSGDEYVLVGNVIKYLSRYSFKNGTEDVEKARWYASKLVDLLKEKANEEVRS